MALKFLNKKGWHTGSLRNIETVWKAEQKHEGEQKKLEELRKQIQDEREKSEFRLMQEQAGLVPKQERLEFLYDSGLQVGKVAQADEYLLGKPVEETVQPESEVGQVAAKPGALFVEEKPASANDSWRKLHSDPLFLIKQQEQAAISRITSNPVKMAQIKKDAEMKRKLKEEKKKKRKEAKRERREKRKRQKQHVTSSEDSSDSDDPRKSRKHRHDSDAGGDTGRKDKRAPVKSRNLSRSPSRSPARMDRRQSPRKARDEERQFEKRKRVPSKSRSRSPLLRDHDRGRWGRDGYGSRASYNLEGRQREHKGSDQEFAGQDSKQMKRALSRSPSRNATRDLDRGRLRRDGYDSRGASKFEGRQREHKGNDKGFEGRSSEQRNRGSSRSPSRSASRSPVRRDHDQRLKGSDGRDFEKRKRVSSRSPSRSASRSPVRMDHDQRSKGSDGRDFEKRKRVSSRSPLRSRSRSPVRRNHDQRLKGSDGRDFEKRKRVPSRSPLRSRSRSPVRRDHDLNRSRRDDIDFSGRLRETKVNDERLKGPEGRDFEKRERVRSPSRSLSRSPGRRRYGLIRARRDDLDSRGEIKHQEHNSSDQRLTEVDDEDSRPRDTRELERGFKSSSNGQFRGTEAHAEVQVAGKKDMNGLSSRPGNKGRPPKPGQKLSDAERAARLAEMQANADVHEEQRWQRLKRAADADDVESKRTEKDKSNEQFIADTQKSIFGAERSSASTIEKSVKRRAHFIERSSADNERNAFRR